MAIEPKIFPGMERVRTDYKWYASQIKSGFKIDRKMKIVSMGSCFAGEIKKHLVDNGYNYLQEEDDKDVWADACAYGQAEHRKRLGSCAWERVFHVPGFRQIMEYSFGLKDYPERLLDSGLGCHDLLRTKIIYKNREIAERDLPDHAERSGKVLAGCDVFIFTMGLAEIWESEGMVLGSSPAHNKITGDYSFRVCGYKETLEELDRAYAIFRRFNPGAKFVLAVSPVHMRATFRDDVDVLSATTYSKALLRTVANDFVLEHPEVFYFPSYEVVTILANIMGDKAYPDGHHVNERVVKRIMEIFEKVCLK